MGDDYYNPWTAETRVQPLRWWEFALVLLLGSAALLAAGFFTAVLLLQLDVIFPWLAR